MIWLAYALDELHAVAVGVANERQPAAALAHPVRLALCLDPLARELAQRAVEVAHADRDVPVRRPHLVRAAVVVERQLELLVLSGVAEEVVRRLELPVADDRRLAPELEPEGLVERPAALRIRDPVHGVEVA